MYFVLTRAVTAVYGSEPCGECKSALAFVMYRTSRDTHVHDTLKKHKEQFFYLYRIYSLLRIAQVNERELAHTV